MSNKRVPPFKSRGKLVRYHIPAWGRSWLYIPKTGSSTLRTHADHKRILALAYSPSIAIVRHPVLRVWATYSHIDGAVESRTRNHLLSGMDLLPYVRKHERRGELEEMDPHVRAQSLSILPGDVLWPFDRLAEALRHCSGSDPEPANVQPRWTLDLPRDDVRYLETVYEADMQLWYEAQATTLEDLPEPVEGLSDKLLAQKYGNGR